MAGIAQFTVVVVLYDPRAALPCPSQQCIPAPHAHRHSQRILVRRGDECSTRILCHCHAGVNVDAGIVNWNAHHAILPPCAFENSRNAPIGGVFHPRDVGGAQQHLAGKVQPLLGSRRDDDLFSTALYRARPPHILCHGFPQGLDTLRIVIA
jgi:hypothetical protein